METQRFDNLTKELAQGKSLSGIVKRGLVNSFRDLFPARKPAEITAHLVEPPAAAFQAGGEKQPELPTPAASAAPQTQITSRRGLIRKISLATIGAGLAVPFAGKLEEAEARAIVPASALNIGQIVVPAGGNYTSTPPAGKSYGLAASSNPSFNLSTLPASSTGVAGISSDTGLAGTGGIYGVTADGSVAPLLLKPASSGTGPPSSGTHQAGEFYVDSSGALYYCYLGGSTGGQWQKIAPPLTCPGGQSPCNGTCVNTSTDLQNCGACGHLCTIDPNGVSTCTSGFCNLTCNPNYVSCSGGCKNLSTDVQNCGSCNHACATDPNGSASCIGGVCNLVCTAGFTKCNSTCKNLASDPQNCGSCGFVCSAGQICSSGNCR